MLNGLSYFTIVIVKSVVCEGRVAADALNSPSFYCVFLFICQVFDDF